MAEIELNTKIFRKDNLDIVYSITGKKHLNGILHYKLKSDNSEIERFGDLKTALQLHREAIARTMKTMLDR